MAVSNVELRVNATQAVTALKNVDGQAKKFNSTISGTSGKLKATTGSLKALPSGLIATGAGAKVAGGGFRALTAAAAPLLGPLIGIGAVISGLGKVFNNLAAQDFASAKLKTLGVNADSLNPKLKSLSNEISGQASSLDLLSASYDVASAGFGEVTELTDVLKASQLGATGGFSELATVADATTSVLNAYGLSSDQAAKLVDGFIQTQNDGKIVVDQYAQQIGRLAPIAAGAGVGIEELNAAISTVTATGVPVESTFAGLRQVIASIQKPTGEASKAAEKLGIDFNATALKTKGLSGVLAEVVEKGGASEETLALLFGSVEARTAILPLLNDQLETFNKNLENQAEAQGTAAKASFEAQNTIQGQLTRLGAAFTNLTTEGSEFGNVIRDVIKVAAVTVEGLTKAFELSLIPSRFLRNIVMEIGNVIADALGIDSVGVLISLEEGWQKVKQAVTDFSDEIIFAGRVIGGVIGQSLKISFNGIKTFFSNVKLIAEMLQKDFASFFQGLQQGFFNLTKPVVNFFKGLLQTAKNVIQKIVKIFNQAFQKIDSLIPDALKDLLGGFEIPKIDVGLDFGDFENPFKDFKFENPFKEIGKDFEFIKEALINFSGIERETLEIILDQAKGKKKVTENTVKLTEAQKQAKAEADKLKETFKSIGESVRNDLVSNLTDAIDGAKSFGDAMKNVLGSLKKRLINLALDKAISGIGSTLSGGKGFGGGFLSGLFGKERGGRVSAGGAFVVGERGPEILQMGSKGGNIIPNSAIGGGGDSITNMITVNVDANQSNVSGNNANANQLGNQIAIAIQTELIKQKRAGGLLA